MTRGLDVVWVLLAIAATVVGIWLGAAGADVSPVVTQAPTSIGAGPGR